MNGPSKDAGVECPACWLDIPASRCGSNHCPRKDEALAKADAEVARLMALTDDEVIAEVVAEGGDPVALAEEVRAVAARAIANHDAGVERIARLEKLADWYDYAAAQQLTPRPRDVVEGYTPEVRAHLSGMSAQAAADIRAVLSLLPHPPVDQAAEEVAGRLERATPIMARGEILPQAATLIRSMSARIAELEGALEARHTVRPADLASYACKECDRPTPVPQGCEKCGRPGLTTCMRFHAHMHEDRWPVTADLLTFAADLLDKAAPSSTSSDTTGGA